MHAKTDRPPNRRRRNTRCNIPARPFKGRRKNLRLMRLNRRLKSPFRSGSSSDPGGQTILEFLALLALLIFSLKGGLLLLWILTGRLWLDHQLYQNLLCRAKGQAENICSERFLRESRKLVLKGQITDIKISRQRRLYKGSLVWNIKNLKIPVRQTFKTP